MATVHQIRFRESAAQTGEGGLAANKAVTRVSTLLCCSGNKRRTRCVDVLFSSIRVL